MRDAHLFGVKLEYEKSKRCPVCRYKTVPESVEHENKDDKNITSSTVNMGDFSSSNIRNLSNTSGANSHVESVLAQR